MEFLNTIFRAVISPELQGALLPIKIFVIIFSLALLAGIIYLLLKSSYLNVVFLEGWKEYQEWNKKAKQKKKEIEQKKEEQKPEKEEEVFSETKDKEFQGRVERTDWERILDKIETQNELNWKLAIIDANKMLEKTLDSQGKELSLEIVSNFKDINKTRNYLEKVLESPEAHIDLKDAKRIIRIYEKALKELGAIE